MAAQAHPAHVPDLVTPSETTGIPEAGRPSSRSLAAWLAPVAIAALLTLRPTAPAWAGAEAELHAANPRDAIHSEARVVERLEGGSSDPRQPSVDTAGPSASRAPRHTSTLLPAPARFGVFPAATYDEEGNRLGGAELALLRDAAGRIDVTVSTGVDGGARTDASAVLSPAADGVRILSERSESHDDQGRSLGVLSIDHELGIGSCTPGDPAEGEPDVLRLPEGERVVNVPLNLLFLPLVRGEAQEIDFQYFLCRGGARLMDFRARLAGRSLDAEGRSLIEVSYGPDLGSLGSWIARRLIPKLSFWFEADQDGTYVAHRMPLFSKGPEVVVVRDVLSPHDLLPLP